MDAITILGTTGAVANIIDTVCRSIKMLRDLHDRWKGADFVVLNLITQLVALKAALAKIEQWISSDLAYKAHHYQLVMDIGESIGCCRILVKSMEDQLAALKCDEHNTLDFQSRLQVVFADKAGRDFQKYIKRQTSALTLLLVACNCKTPFEQKALLESPLSREVFDQVKDDSSSLIVVIDKTSGHSTSTRDTDQSSKMSMKFQFDAELLGSQVYQRAIRSLVRSAGPREPVQKPSCRVLLLGARDGGKETMMKHMKLSNRNSHRVTEILCYRLTVLSALVDLVCNSLEACENAGLKLIDDEDRTRINLVLQQELPIQQMEPELLAATNYLGAQIRSHLLSCDKSQALSALDHSTIYFLTQIQTITDPDYVPTLADVLNLPSKYEYIWNEKLQETSLSMENVTMQFIGCCGDFQSQKKEWIPKFKDMNAVVFVVDLCSYDKILPPSPNNIKLMKCVYFFNLVGTGRSIYTKLMETLFLFDAVVNCRSYRDTTIFLFFTGFEKLKSSLGRSPLSDHFPDFKGDSNTDAAYDYILRLFSRLNKARLSVRPEIISLKNSTDFDLDSLLTILSENISPDLKDSHCQSVQQKTFDSPHLSSQRTSSVPVMGQAQLGCGGARIPSATQAQTTRSSKT